MNVIGKGEVLVTSPFCRMLIECLSIGFHRLLALEMDRSYGNEHFLIREIGI